MSQFIDIHSHFLPGFDDGPESVEQCIETARRYRSIGIQQIVATPHWIRSTGWAASPGKIRREVEKTEIELGKAGVPLSILPGMEIEYTEYFEEDLLASRLMPLGRSEYFLVEFPLSVPGEELFNHFLEEVQHKKFKAILAHPERCAVFQNKPELLNLAVEKDILVQINIDSLLGFFGSKVQQTAAEYLVSGLVHFLATDSHGRDKRFPPGRKDWQKLVELLGEDALQTGCCDNPQKMLAGKNIPPIGVDVNRLNEKLPMDIVNKSQEKNETSGKQGKLKRIIKTIVGNKKPTNMLTVFR